MENVARGIGHRGNEDKRELEVKQAYDQLDKQGHVIEIENLKERHQQMANDYLEASKDSPRDVMLVTPTHAEGKDVTEAIRNKLKEEGKIGQEDRAFKHLVNCHLTETEKQLYSSYEQGQFVEFNQNVKGYRAGSRYEITGRDENNNVLVKGKDHQHPVPLPLEQSSNFNVYKKESLKIAENDRLRITKNIRSIEGNHLNNGQTYEAKGFTDDGHIKLSNGKTLHKNAMHLNTGYYQTSHGAQGKDAKTVLVAQSSRSMTASNDKQFYVTISRGSENIKVYTDDKQSLREAVARSGDRMSAAEIAKKSQQEKDKEQSQNRHAEYMRKVNEFKKHHVQPAIEKLKTRHEQRQTGRAMEGPGLGRA